jgi:hypothetical protein
MKNNWGCSQMQFRGSNSLGFVREAKEKFEKLQW